jgi:GAF domain-containing protein
MAAPVKKKIVSAEKDKPVLDEQTLGKLLEAAYVLQEHNRALREMELGFGLKRDQIEAEERSAKPPAPPSAKKDDAPAAAKDFTLTLGQIVETQHQIHVRQLTLESAMALVVERLTEIATSTGAAIGILEEKKVRYRAAAGPMALPVESEVPMAKALCVACLRTGQVMRCADVNPEFLLDTEECRRRGIQSLIAVPIFHEGVVVGGLELYFPKTHAFTEQDVHTCQLMAGLVTEALSRHEEISLKKSLANERAVMLETLEKLKPNLAALVEPAGKEPVAQSVPAPSPHVPIFACRKCGNTLVGDEQFCGKCGAPRGTDYEPPSMQSKVASLLAMKKAAPPAIDGDEAAQDDPYPSIGSDQPPQSLADSIEEQIPGLFSAVETSERKSGNPSELPEELQFANILEESQAPEQGESGEHSEEESEKAADGTALVKHPSNWGSAAAARDFLEQVAPENPPGGFAHFWNNRRGDIYLAVAVLLVAAVIRWGIWSDHSVGATGGNPATAAHRKQAPDEDLSFFDQMMIKLGLAEAPQAPEYKGNPDTQVWVDLHTALYYCPGADLYGKTQKGKYSSQRDAQLDQFEPAYRKACD